MLSMWMRIATTVLVLAGLTMFLNAILNLGLPSGVMVVLALIHLVSGISLVGLYEANLARRKRGMVVIAGKEISLAGRIVLTLALIIGLFLFLNRAASILSSDAYKTVIWLHAPIGLIAIGLGEAAMSRLRVKKA